MSDYSGENTTWSLTRERINALIPDTAPQAGELRLLFNSLLPQLPNQQFIVGSVYHEPLDVNAPSITHEQLREALTTISRNRVLEDLPVPAYLCTLGIEVNPNIQQMALSWAATNAHILLTLQGMGDRSTQIRLLCARFRLAITHPAKNSWLWQWLPLLNEQSSWKQLASALAAVENSLSVNNAGAAHTFDGAASNKKLLALLPKAADRRMAEVRLAYQSAIENKPKIVRTRVSTGGRKTPKPSEPAIPRLTLDHRSEKDPIDALSFASEIYLEGVNPDEQHYDQMADRWVDSNTPPAVLISDSPAAQVYTIKNQAAHISRRGFEFATDIRNLPLDQVQAIACQLDAGVRSNSLTDALLLLSLLTGTRTSELGTPANLFSDQKIYFSHKLSSFLWIIKLDLPSSATKTDQRLLNSTSQSLGLPLPRSLVSCLEQFRDQTVSQEEFQERIQEIKKSLQIPLLSLGRISSALHQIIRRNTGDRLIADILCGVSPRHSPAIYYTSIQWPIAHTSYRSAIELIAQDAQFDFAYLNVSFEKRSSGSATAVKPAVARRYFQRLLEPCNQPADLIEKHNTYTVWLWHIILLLTSIRPVDHAPGTLKTLDIDTGLMWVSDKEALNSGESGRFVPLCQFLKTALLAYLKHLTHLQKKLGVISEDLGPIILNIQSGEYPLLILYTDNSWEPVTPGMVQQLVSHLPWLPPNWMRHFGRTYLLGRHPDHLIDAVFGHELPDQEAFNPYSSHNLQDFQTIAATYDLMAQELELHLPSAWGSQ